MHPRTRLMIAAVVIAAIATVASLAYVWYWVNRPGGGTPNSPAVQLALVQTGLAWPIALAFASDGRIFFAERNTGDIRIIEGGVIAFGPDGKLWAVVGENANPSLAQNPMSLLGKVLRMNSDGSAAADNPFYSSMSWENRVYTYGHRNMFGIAWHPVTGRAYITENGPTCNDEVNLLAAGSNFGWGPMATCGSPPLPPTNTNRDGANPVLPLDWWTPTIAPTNAAFYTGSLLPQSRNHLMFGAYNDARLRELAFSADGTTVVNETILLTAPSGILDVEMGRDGLLWVTTATAIFRLALLPAAAPSPVPQSLPALRTQTQPSYDRWLGRLLSMRELSFAGSKMGEAYYVR